MIGVLPLVKWLLMIPFLGIGLSRVVRGLLASSWPGRVGMTRPPLRPPSELSLVLVTGWIRRC